MSHDPATLSLQVLRKSKTSETQEGLGLCKTEKRETFDFGYPDLEAPDGSRKERLDYFCMDLGVWPKG